MVFQGVKNAVKSRIRDLIDSEITKQARPFMEMGVGPDGQDCSDIVINEDLDISIENMIVKTSLVNETLMKQSSPFRVSMVSAKRIFFDIPWENLTSSDAKWTLEVKDLQLAIGALLGLRVRTIGLG